jgi:hypothetical protein
MRGLFTAFTCAVLWGWRARAEDGIAECPLRLLMCHRRRAHIRVEGAVSAGTQSDEHALVHLVIRACMLWHSNLSQITMLTVYDRLPTCIPTSTTSMAPSCALHATKCPQTKPTCASGAVKTESIPMTMMSPPIHSNPVADP